MSSLLFVSGVTVLRDVAKKIAESDADNCTEDEENYIGNHESIVDTDAYG